MSETITDRSAPSPSPSGRPRLPVPVALFVASVLLLGWLGPVVDRLVDAEPGDGPGMALWLILPAGTATLLRWRTVGFADAGFGLRGPTARRWFEASAWFYPLVMATTLGVGLAAGRVDLAGDQPAFGRFAVLFLAGLLPVTVAAIMEEFGWRGYLVPRLDRAGFGRWTNHLVVGVVWGAWHLPYLTTLWDFSEGSAPVLGLRVVFGSVVAAVVYGEIRLATGSVWPAVLMHTMANAFAGPLVGGDEVLVLDRPTPWLLSPGIDGGLVALLTAIGAAIVVPLARRRSAGQRVAITPERASAA